MMTWRQSSVVYAVVGWSIQSCPSTPPDAEPCQHDRFSSVHCAVHQPDIHNNTNHYSSSLFANAGNYCRSGREGRAGIREWKSGVRVLKVRDLQGLRFSKCMSDKFLWTSKELVETTPPPNIFVNFTGVTFTYTLLMSTILHFLFYQNWTKKS